MDACTAGLLHGVTLLRQCFSAALQLLDVLYDATDLKRLGALLLGESRLGYARHRASLTGSDGRKSQLPQWLAPSQGDATVW